MSQQLKRRLLDALNLPLALTGLGLVPTWELQRWTTPQSFQFLGRSFRYFSHAYNCGWPPYATERTVELALADFWLERMGLDELIEIGAVTPYYWPQRVRVIVDPFDPHPQVTCREDLMTCDLRQKRVLSISTLEHVGTGDYGLPKQPEAAIDAFNKIFTEASEFLVTVPTGYNPIVDEFVFADKEIPTSVSVHYLVCGRDGFWRQESEPDKARLPYGTPLAATNPLVARRRIWANAVVVLERGNVFDAEARGT